MEISLYNEDTSEYFAIVDLPDDIASFLIKDAEFNGSNVEEYVRQIIMETIYDRVQTMGLGDNY